jgi:hypothetical protein
MSGLPRLGRGRPSPAARAAYDAEVEAFCARILEINSTLDFEVGSRGWGYILEGDGTVNKGDFDLVQQLINDCRKSGLLPINICAEDGKRSADGIERLDDTDIEGEADWAFEQIREAHLYYRPISFWDELDVYVEVAVEKSDLKSLFSKVTSEFHVPIQNVGGWGDLNVRASMMRRFREWEDKGKQCVLLYCGDHDPGGLQISSFLRANLWEMSRSVGWAPQRLIVDRFGLDYDFIEANGLTWIDNLETGSGKSLADPKHTDHFKPYVQDYLKRFGVRKVEANALVVRPEAGRELCRQAILKYVPSTAVADYDKRLAAIREELRLAILARIAGGAAP